MKRALLLTAGLLAASCRRDEPKLQQLPGLRDPQGNPIQQLSRPVADAAAPSPPPPTFDSPTFGTAPNPAALSATDAAQAAPALPDAAEERDLSGELAALLPQLASCVDLPRAAAQPGGRLMVNVSAVVLGTGRVSRVTVRAPGQPPAALACFERQALSLRLSDGVPDAPTTVEAATEIVVKAAPTVEGDAAMPEPIPPAPTQPVAPTNPDVARPQPDDIARPANDGVAGPPL